MKAVILALLLSATTAAYADIVVVPSLKGCKQAEQAGTDTVLLDACRKLAQGEKVNLACPLQGCQATTK